MASKLSGNGIWDTKWMLPEHKEGHDRFVESLQHKPRVTLDEQEWEQISRALQQSMQFKVPLAIKLYDPLEELKVVGVIGNLSKRHGQFKVGDDWFLIDDIEGIEVDEEPC